MSSFRQQARKGLIIYLLVVIAGSAPLQWGYVYAKATGNRRIGVPIVLALMWMPAIASLVTRAILREGIRDVSFRWGGWNGTRSLIVAWLMPLGVGFLAYGIAWSTGLAAFKTHPPPLPVAVGSVGSFALLLLGCMSWGMAFQVFAAAGEEIGWRGFLLLRLLDAGVPQPLLVSGLIWAAWHVPLILAGTYAASSHVWVSVGLFFVICVALAYLLGTFRLASGSVWPAIVGHAAWNSAIQDVFDYSTVDAPDSNYVGESGLLVAVVTVVFAVGVMRRKWPKQRAPGVPFISAEPARGAAVAARAG
jgi:uncharacterized protein